jgi:hypothetical protein
MVVNLNIDDIMYVEFVLILLQVFWCWHGALEMV